MMRGREMADMEVRGLTQVASVRSIISVVALRKEFNSTSASNKF